jgi:hypothetical protein
LINQHPEGVSAAAMRQLMSTRYPDGLCNHFYQEMFGTLYSFIADPQDGRMDICFGSPAMNSGTLLLSASQMKLKPTRSNCRRPAASVNFGAKCNQVIRRMGHGPSGFLIRLSPVWKLLLHRGRL